MLNIGTYEERQVSNLVNGGRRIINKYSWLIFYTLWLKENLPILTKKSRSIRILSFFSMETKADLFETRKSYVLFLIPLYSSQVSGKR